MTHSELINKISEITEIDAETTKSVLKALIEVVVQETKAGNEVQIWRLGKFERRTYKKRKCYNPIRDEIVEIEGSYTPAFKPGSKFRYEINN